MCKPKFKLLVPSLSFRAGFFWSLPNSHEQIREISGCFTFPLLPMPPNSCYVSQVVIEAKGHLGHAPCTKCNGWDGIRRELCQYKCCHGNSMPANDLAIQGEVGNGKRSFLLAEWCKTTLVQLGISLH